jgi:tRNA(Ile)-lysidine synthase
MALLHGLLECGFRKLVVCHLDHRLRGGVAAADAIFVARQARRLGLRVHRGECDVASMARQAKLSLETAARSARHQFFADCARRENCPRIFLGHHQEDQLETIMHHFFRGSGRRGLGGMSAESRVKVGRKTLIVLRPLLPVPRKVINDWVAERDIKWREDASNFSPVHSRNRLRHELLPVLEKILGRNFRQPVLRLAEVLAAEDDWLDLEVEALPWRADAVSLSVQRLREVPLALQRRVVLRWLRARSVDQAGFQEVARVLSLIGSGANVPARVNLPGERQARRRAGKIFLASATVG